MPSGAFGIACGAAGLAWPQEASWQEVWQGSQQESQQSFLPNIPRRRLKRPLLSQPLSQQLVAQEPQEVWHDGAAQDDSQQSFLRENRPRRRENSDRFSQHGSQLSQQLVVQHGAGAGLQQVGAGQQGAGQDG